MVGPYDGKVLSAVGIVVPLNGSTEAAAWKVFILLRVDSYNPALLRATAGFACLLALCALVSISALKCWFIGRVVKPLWRLTGAVGKHLEDPERGPPPEPGEWGVTTQLAEHLHELLQRLDASDARVHSIELEIQRKVRKQVLGLDRQLRRAKDQAILDPLTRLRNRTFLEEELQQLFQRCRAKSQDLAAVMMDVDNFKQYNDAHGHQIGDVLLRFVGSLLRGGIRPTDHAIRYGGDEFLLLLPDTTSAEAGAIADRIVKLFAQYISCLRGNHSLSMSAGVASLAAGKPASGHALVAKADAALYVAKRKGKNTVAGHRTPKDSAAAWHGTANIEPRC
jgi:diguanylate cyclase (GGDEF)-like protein